MIIDDLIKNKYLFLEKGGMLSATALKRVKKKVMGSLLLDRRDVDILIRFCRGEVNFSKIKENNQLMDILEQYVKEGLSGIK